MLQSSSAHINVCIRCGQTRIVIKEWEEVSEETGIKSKKSVTSCPDPLCQQEVNKTILNKQKDREKKEMARMARIAKMNERYSDVH